MFFISSSGIDRLALGDHAAMAIDFKGEGLNEIFSFIFDILMFYSFNLQSNNRWCDT
jgi:hypothetical protein